MFKKFLMGCMMVIAANVSANAQELTVSAAASLTNAFNELCGVFEKDNPGVKVRTNYAASNPLLRQIVEGAPVDVFASADQQTMDQAAGARVIHPESRKNFALNELVLIAPKGAAKVKDLADLEKVERIAVGTPESVPAGRYTRAALSSKGLWEKLQPRYIFGANVRQVLDYVARGEADAGFVYKTDALQQKDKVAIIMEVGGHDPVSYPLAIVNTGQNPQLAQKFVDFVLSPAGQEILARYGFSKP